MQTTNLDFFSMRREFHIEIKEISLICFHFLPPNTSRWDAGIHNRCSSLCYCYTAHLALGCSTLSKGLIPFIGYTRTTNLLKMIV